MKQKKLIFYFFVNRNWKKLTDSRRRAKILADNRKSHHPIETLVQDRSSRRTTIAFVKDLSVWLCDSVWFVDGKVPSIRMQVKWETFLLIIFLNNVIESAKQKKTKKNYTACNLAWKPLLEVLKSNSKMKCPRSSASEDNRQCLFGTWLDLSV